MKSHYDNICVPCKCPKCGRKLNSKTLRCTKCGHQVYLEDDKETKSFFRSDYKDESMF